MKHVHHRRGVLKSLQVWIAFFIYSWNKKKSAMSLTHCNGSPYLYHQCVSGPLSFVLAHGLCSGLSAASVWEDHGSSRPSRPGTASFHCCTCSPSCRPARVHTVPPHRDCTCVGDSPGCQTFAVLLETCGPFCVPWFLHLVHLSPQESSHLEPASLVWWTSRNTLEASMVYQMEKHRVEPCKHRSRGSPDLLSPSPRPRGIASKALEEMGSYSSSTWGLGSPAMNTRGLRGSPSSSLLLEPQASVRAYPSMKVPGTTRLSWFLLPGSFQATLRSERALTLDCSADTAEPWVCWLEGEDGVLGSGLVLEGHSSSGSLRWMTMFWEVAGRGSASSEVTASSMIKSECQWSIMVAKGDGKKQVRSHSLITAWIHTRKNLFLNSL